MKNNTQWTQLVLLKITLIFLGFSFSHCTTPIIPDEKLDQEQENENSPSTRAAFDDYFDWDRLDNFPIYNPNIGKTDFIELPWAKGSTASLGIPTEWLDENAYHPDFSQRYYSRENAWVLVYSNLTKNTTNKYFALYNEYTGIMRFFFYALSSASGGGNSSAFWGLKIDKSSSLFNFTHEFADSDAIKGDSPAFITSTPGTQMGGQFIGRGYQVNNWYGIEIECAYDPTIKGGSMHNFEMMGWSSNKTTITGSGITTGSITGTIKYAAPSSNFNVSLSNMFNQSNSSKNMTADNGGIINGLGGKIEEGIKEKDSFFTGLWDNIKSKATAGIGEGVKSGLKAILTSGGSVAAKALSGAVSSVLGIGGSKPSVAKVDLSLSANTKFTFEAETALPGWGQISQFPVPGSSTNPNDMPLYNKSLGVWNLSKTPTVLIEGIAHDCRLSGSEPQFIGGVYNFRYYLDCPQSSLVINNEIKSKVTIKNFSAQLVCNEFNDLIFSPNHDGVYERYEPKPIGFLNKIKYYSKELLGVTSDEVLYPALYGSTFKTDSPSWGYIQHIFPEESYHGKFHAIISFDLIENTTGKVYSFSRWFNVNLGMQKVNFRAVYINNSSDYDFYIDRILHGGHPPYTNPQDIIQDRNVIQNPNEF